MFGEMHKYKKKFVNWLLLQEEY